MIKPTDTLIDNLYRETFASRPQIKGLGTIHTILGVRKALRSARRFVLSENMSAFLSDLACEAFVGDVDRMKEGHLPRKLERALEQMRVSARLPHKITWIEHSSWGRKCRFSELFDRPLPTCDKTDREGWLLETIEDGSEQNFCATIFLQIGNMMGALPFIYDWSTYDTRGDEPNENTSRLSEIITGIPGYRTSHIQVSYTRNFFKNDKEIADANEVLSNHAGAVRYMWALLATINDLPVTFKRVEQSRGFIGGHLYRKFLEHSIITLNVPDARDVRKIARQAIAIVRKRAHQVRGHWRRDYRHEGGRLWIREHQRGDASIGFVTHDYSVEHPKC